MFFTQGTVCVVDIKTFKIIKTVSLLNSVVDTNIYSSGVSAVMHDAGRGTGKLKKNEKINHMNDTSIKKTISSTNTSKYIKPPISHNFGKTAPEKNSTFLYNDDNDTQYTTSSKNINSNNNNVNNAYNDKKILAGFSNINSAIENTQRYFCHLFF